MPVYAGYDLGGSLLKYGFINQAGNVLFQGSSATPTAIKDLLPLLGTTWEILKKEAAKTITSCGLGFPGLFSLKDQKFLQSPHYPDLDHYDLIPALSQIIDVPFFINNDANLAAFGEYKLGGGQGVQSLVLLTIGTGIGTGIILDGKLWQGTCGFAGELGHAPVNPEGDPCPCGSLGCLETEVSAPAIVNSYKQLKNLEKDINLEEVCKRAEDGDPEALRVYARAGHYLGVGLAIAINLLNPEKILLGGGVMEAGDLLLSSALPVAEERSYTPAFDCCRIEKASLGNTAGFIGAALWSEEQSDISNSVTP